MAEYKLFCLGNPGFELDGQPVKLEMRKALALLVYLRIAANDHSRESLAVLFWPEYDQQHAQSNLRRTLASLNKSLRIDLLEADREKIGLREPSRIWLDVEEFLEKLTSRRLHSHPKEETCSECQAILESALQLYRGDFLEGFNLRDCPDFDDWQLQQRESLRQEFGLALQKLVETYASQSQWKTAIEHARRWVGLDCLHEPARRALMDLYARSGQRSAALHQYEELARLLNEQLGQQPEPDTRQLFEQIRKRDEEKKVIEIPEQASSFPLLKTKLYIPAPPASHVRRSALTNRLDEVERKALTIISAPAGFGKTTLLAEWIAQTPLPVAWLSLDTGDNDPYRFLAYIIAALESVHEDVGQEARQFMQSPQPVPAHIILASLINDLGKVDEPYVLVLDDYQFITETAVHEVVAYLLDHLPVNLHMLIATRADPPLQLGRLRAYDQMLELRTRELRFNFEETTEFLNTVMKLGLSVEDIEALETRTEGWVVGLKMVALSLQGRSDTSDFIRAFSGSQRYVLDYLVEEVLKRQPAHIQTFLLETSILEKLNGPLCDALIENRELRTENSQPLSGLVSPFSSQSILEYLEKCNLFLIPLDENKQWYRYHHLFADLLRSRLQQFSAERVVALQLQASRWYETEGLMLDAVGHAMNAKDFHRAADLVEKMAYYSIYGADYATLQNWIDRIPENLVSSHPWVCILQAFTLIASGKQSKIEEWLRKAESSALSLQQEGDEPYQAEEIQNHVILLRAYSAFFTGDLVNAIKQGTILLEKRHTMRASLRERVSMAMGEFYMTVGEFEKCIPLFREAINLGKQSSNLFLLSRSTFRLGGVLKSQGKLVEAEKTYQDALRLLRESGLRDSSLMGRPEIGLGDILRERGDLDTAERLLTEGLRHSQLQEQPYDLVYAHLYISKLEHEKGNVHRALELLEQADELFQMYVIPPTIRLIWGYYCVPLWIAMDGWEQIERWIKEFHLISDVPLSYGNELQLLALSRVRIAEGKLTHALNLLSRLAQDIEAAGRYARLIEIWNLTALALHRKGSTDEALTYLRKSLALGEPEGFRQIFLDEGEPMILMLKRLRESDLVPRLKDYVNRLLEAYTPS